MRSVLLAALLLLTACDTFPEVKKQDTIEAYEQYLKEHGDSNYAMEAKGRLEVLYIEKARADKSLEAYDAYLNRFPQGMYAKDAYGEREAHLWSWADSTNTVEAWQKYLKEYPSFDTSKAKKAKKRMMATEYAPNLVFGDATVTQVNLAENPEGPLDGWLISADVTNNGDQTLRYLQVTARFLDDKGERVGEEAWPLVSENYGIPMEEEKKVPVKPGETRTWELMTGNVPKTWNQKVQLVATSIGFKELKAGQ